MVAERLEYRNGEDLVARGEAEQIGSIEPGLALFVRRLTDINDVARTHDRRPGAKKGEAHVGSLLRDEPSCLTQNVEALVGTPDAEVDHERAVDAVSLAHALPAPD